MTVAKKRAVRTDWGNGHGYDLLLGEELFSVQILHNGICIAHITDESMADYYFEIKKPNRIPDDQEKVNEMIEILWHNLRGHWKEAI